MEDTLKFYKQMNSGKLGWLSAEQGGIQAHTFTAELNSRQERDSSQGTDTYAGRLWETDTHTKAPRDVRKTWRVVWSRWKHTRRTSTPTRSPIPRALRLPLSEYKFTDRIPERTRDYHVWWGVTSLLATANPNKHRVFWCGKHESSNFTKIILIKQ